MDSVQRSVTVCRGPGDHSGTSSSGGALERAGRSSVKEQANFHRVEARLPVIREMLFPPRFPSDRLVRDDREHKTTSICVSLPRSESRSLGCSESRLEPLEFYLPFSSVPTVTRNFGALKEFQRERLPDRSILANSELVYRSGGEMCNQISSSRRAFPFSGERRQNLLSQAALHFPASRVDFIKEAVRKKGLSEGAANILSFNHKESTKRQYQTVWSYFLNYLDENNITHSRVSVEEVINFLAYHLLEFDRAYSTIAVYKNALRLPLLYGLEVDMDTPLMSEFMRGVFGFKPKPKSSRLPKWDLNLLLEWFTSEEFWPPESCRWYRLLQKTFV